MTPTSETLEQVRALVARGEVRVSFHGQDELAADNVHLRDVIDGLEMAVVVEAGMSTRLIKKLVREGEFVAEVEVMLEEAEDSWAPYLSLADAYKLDDVR